MQFGLSLDLDRAFVPSVLRGILHTIFFNRAFGKVRAVEVDLDFIEFAYPRILDEVLEEEINQKVAEFSKDLDESGSPQGKVVVTFFETQPKAKWFGTETGWEEWQIVLRIRPTSERERIARAKQLENDLSILVTQIVKYICEHQDHIPSIPKTSGAVSFPYKITSEKHTQSWGKLLKDFISTTPPGLS